MNEIAAPGQLNRWAACKELVIKRKSMLPKIICIALLIAIFVMDGAVLGSSGHRAVRDTSAGISQLIEDRNGRATCWGVVIQLRDMTFQRSINANQIKVVEGKHGHNLTHLMTWNIDRKGKRLTIKFKAHAGDFGAGNLVQVDIERSAFVEPIQSGNLKFDWAIGTDVM
ncbi:MAG TPA: hypothetical protein VGJ48_24245 [Pyrinomonadaceae bacterium]